MLSASSVQEMNSTAFMLKIDRLLEKTNDNFKLNLYRNADNFCLFFCEYCLVNFHFETYLYQYKEKMSRTRQQMNITEETMELSLIEIGYGEHSVQETYFTALSLKLDQKKLHEWKINHKSIIPLLRPCYTKRRIPGLLCG